MKNKDCIWPTSYSRWMAVFLISTRWRYIIDHGLYIYTDLWIDLPEILVAIN